MALFQAITMSMVENSGWGMGAKGMLGGSHFHEKDFGERR